MQFALWFRLAYCKLPRVCSAVCRPIYSEAIKATARSASSPLRGRMIPLDLEVDTFERDAENAGPRGENILQNGASVLNFSKRAFCHASPTVWNSLPQSDISDLTVA